jgi:hypothetical protein
MSITRTLATTFITAALAATVAGGVALPAQASDTAPAPATTQTEAAAGSAALAAPYAHMTIRSIGGGQYSVTVSGQATTYGAARYSISLFGEDTFFDDTPVCEEFPLYTNAYGGFWHQFTCPGTLLNEDWGQDENFARVSVYQDGVSTRLRSNTVKGYY